MASSSGGVRFVKCPKCYKVLTEFAEVPVYKCGGCGTVLRAKVRASATGKTVRESLENNSQKLADSSSLVSGSTSLANQTHMSAFEVEKVVQSDLHVSNSNIVLDTTRKGEVSEYEENRTQERPSESLESDDQSSLRRDDINAKERTQGSREVLVDEVEKSLSSTLQDPDVSSPNEITEEPSYNTGNDAGFVEEDTNLASLAYDGSISSRDEQQEVHVPHKRPPLSRRTFRRDDINAKERTQGSREVLVDEEVEKSLSSTLQDLNVSSPNEIMEEPSYNTGNDAGFIEEDTKLASLAYDGSISSRDEQEVHVPHKRPPLSRRTFRHQKSSSMDDSTGKETQPQTQACRSFARDTTFGSEDFHSVQNWMGSEIDDDLISIPTDLLSQGNSFKSLNANPSTKVNYMGSEHLKILRKVDELRDELSEFLTKTVDGKQASRLKPRTTRFAPLEQPKYSCLGRSHNLPSRLHKFPIHKDEVEKHVKAKQKTIKQYYRPVYGGAPFVICYKCWKLLQLPADFLVSRKRLHKLRCGACSEVLVFSFRSRAHSTPHSPVEAQHPPSEVDHCNDYIREGDFVSHSDTFSSEPEPVLNVSRSSSYSIKAGEKGSSLHGLMGYSSASELLFEPLRGYESSQATTPEFYRPPLRGDQRRYGHYGNGTSTMKSSEIQEEEETHEQITPRRRGSAIHGLLKKGVQELSHGLESMKLKVQSKG